MGEDGKALFRGLSRRVMRRLALVALFACSHVDAPAGSLTKLRVVPQGMVGVSLVGADTARHETLTAGALQSKVKAANEEAERVGPSTEGSPGIFFYGFDEHRLVYFAGHTHWRCNGLGCWDYVADELYVIGRSGGVEKTLGVQGQIDLYERGQQDIKGGMTPAQVRAVNGPPTRIEPLQVVGSERWYYPTRTILFLDGEVAGIEAP